MYYITQLNSSKLNNINMIDDNKFKNLRNKYHKSDDKSRFLKPDQPKYDRW